MKRALLLGLSLAATLLFAGLGVWQVERLAWKLDLIDRIEARLAAPPVPIPDAGRWAGFDAKAEEYRKVAARGTFVHDRETLVQAVTERGAGFWVLTPLRTPQGFVLINRGFVPSERRLPASRREGQVPGQVTVTGLLRITEPGGGFLRSNDPGQERWYSRDVAAIADARNLSQVAPFFVDADAASNVGGYPIGGLTVVRFRNSHLVYAITWFTLALLGAGAVYLLLSKRRPL